MSLTLRRRGRLGRLPSFRNFRLAAPLVGVCLFMTLAVVASSATLALSFARAGYPAGEDPVFAAVGDLNGDGRPDIATANEDEDSTVVLLNKGDGSFGRQRAHATGSGPRSVAIEELNGDGRRDLITANVSGDTVSVFLNRGKGLFALRRTFVTGEGPESLAVGDLNGDARHDVATQNGDVVSVLINKGDGSLERRVDYSLGNPGLLLGTSIAIGDLNADGRSDLAVAAAAPERAAPGRVAVFLNKGDGTFAPKVDYTTGRTPLSVAIGDLNVDGSADLAAANSQVTGTSTISVLTNRGDGTFLDRRDYTTGREPQSVAVADLNGDRKPDLATANWSETVSVLLNSGDGTFQSRRNYAAGSSATNIAIADLNSDHTLDLVTANEGEIAVFLNATGRCAVPQVKGKTLPLARRAITRAGCRVGTKLRAHSRTMARGRVLSQSPHASRVVPRGGKVNLVVSLGRKQ
jgi:hypothetical protein